MLILLLILSLFIAVLAGYLYFFKRSDPPAQLPETTDLRPLFEPSEAELRVETVRTQKQEREAELKIIADFRQQKELEFLNELNEWKREPSAASFAALLKKSGSGESFASAAEAANQVFQNGKSDGISASELTELLESHFWLVPAEERTPGVSYRIQTVLSSLRPASAKRNANS